MKTFKLAIMAALSLVGTAQLHAQQQTNLVQNIGIQLLGLKQGGSSSSGGNQVTNIDTVNIGTRDVIKALAAATANSFSSTSKLVLVTALDGSSVSVQVRDGNNAPVDVSDLFLVQNLSGSVTTSILNKRSGRGAAVGYQFMLFDLQDGDGVALNLHLGVFGIGTSESSTPGPQGAITQVNVSGSGDRNGNLLILQGSVQISGHTLEVVDGGFHGDS